MKWIPITMENSITDLAIVTQLFNRRTKARVTIGFPGWGWRNDTIAYMPLPRPANEDKRGWKSEYWGDELPQRGRNYIVQIQGVQVGKQDKTQIIEARYDRDGHWLWVPDGFEIMAWRNFPKPFQPN